MITPFSIGVVLALASVQDGPLIETELAWGGRVWASSFTELTLRATGSGDASVVFETAGRSPIVTAELKLQNGAAVMVSMPVESDGRGDVALRYSVDGRPWTNLDAGGLEHGAGTVILAGEAATAYLGHFAGTTIVSAADLPRLPLAYTHVAALALGRDALARLDEAQLRALLEHIGSCGRVLLIDPPTQVERLVNQRAACGGRYLLATGADVNAGQVLETLVTRSADRLPDERELGWLLRDRGKDIRLIALYLGGFLLLFITLNAVPRLRGVGLGFCLLATALAGLLWTGGSRQSFVAWAEVAAMERVARYASLERSTAMGRGTQAVHLQSLARSPMRITGDGLVLYWSETVGDRYLDWTASLLQEMHVFSAGSFPVESRLRAGTDGTIVTVCNRGEGATPPAYLHWQGANYDVPALASGARWIADESTATAEPSPHMRLLTRRSSGHAVTLLQPLNVPVNGGAQQAWLMRTESDTQEVSPCRG